MHQKVAGKVGIASAAAYVPRFRLPSSEIVRAWGSCAARIKHKSVMGFDEDTVTMSVSAARAAMAAAGISPQDVGVVAIASTSFPYEVRSIVVTMMEMLGIPRAAFPMEYGQSTRAGTEALIGTVCYMVATGVKFGLVTVADAQMGAPEDAVDHGFGAAAVAYVLGPDTGVASLEGWRSATFECAGDRFRSYGGRFVQDIGVRAYTERAYEMAVGEAVRRLLEDVGLTPQDFAQVIFCDYDGRLGNSLAGKMGFRQEQLPRKPLFSQLGDVGSAAGMLQLASVLEGCREGDRVLLATYGSGGAADALVMCVGDDAAGGRLAVGNALAAEGETIDYLTYLKLRKVLFTEAH